MLRLLLIQRILFATSSFAECYSEEESEKIAGALKALDYCQVEYAEQERFIAENLRKYAEAGPSFWQEPSFIVSGVAVSFSAGLVLGLVFDKLK